MGDTPPLLPQHRRTLTEASAIAPNVIEARGYRTITIKAELSRLGFSDNQRAVPTLLMPVYNAGGEIALYHHRPDQPRIEKGRVVKYEFPRGAGMALDVHPFIKEKVRDPNVPLFITEGVKKADAAISHGLCCAAVLGVWNWRGRNEHGGLTALPDWEGIALKAAGGASGAGRQVYLCFDSDVMIKPAVQAALNRLAALLKHKGALVAFIYLPAASDGSKTGLDDFFAAGRTTDDLLALATTERRQPADEEGYQAEQRKAPYEEGPHGLTWLRTTSDGNEYATPLTNFTARIIGDVEEDDGAETRRVFTMETRLAGRVQQFDLPAEQFTPMNWPVAQLGAGAIVYPGQGTRDHARAAIQTLSRAAPQQVRTHTGWIESSGGSGIWAYCHAGGIITGFDRKPAPNTDDPTTSHRDETLLFDTENNNFSLCQVRLPDALQRFRLPDAPAGADLSAAFAAFLHLLDVGRAPVVLPVVAAALRAPLGSCDFSVFLAGSTGVFKTELAALAQQFFGAELNARRLPADWSATDNFIEGLAFQAKDALMVCDEFVPRGSTHDQQRYHAKADRVLRAQGNSAGRGRMRADGTLRAVKPPRGLILSTGEEVPQGHSLRARMLIVEVAPGDINTKHLTPCQTNAAAGLYAGLQAAYIAWLARNYERVQAGRCAAFDRYRLAAAQQGASGETHRRTAGIIADLALGVDSFTVFAFEAGLLSQAEGEALRTRFWQALLQSAGAQSHHHEDSEPTQRFLDLVRGAIASGDAHLSTLGGDAPKPYGEPFGWRLRRIGSGGFTTEEWNAQGERIGYVDGDDLYLLPDPAYSAAQKVARESGDAVAIKPKTLSKRLFERGLLVTTEKERDRLIVRVSACGARQAVWHLRTDSVIRTEKPAQ